MKLLLPTLLLPLLTTLAAPLPKRAPADAQAIYNDITAIDTAVRRLTAALTAYPGGITPASPVFTQILAVHAANRQGFADANAAAPLTSAESRRIVQHVDDSVGVSIPASVQALEGRKAAFDAAELTSVVESTVLLLKNDHETFSAATGAKLSADQVAPGLVAAGKIDAVLQEASLYYAA